MLEQPIPYRPHYCVWELTLACNLRCGHCGSSAGAPRPEELDTAQCVDVVNQLADLECRLITLSGGEPTLRSDWEEIARAAVARGVTVNMVSNGTTITAELAGRMATSGLANVGISIDGPQRIHDEVRGQGTFQRTAQGMMQLQRAGVRTAVLTHLDQSTAACLPEIHQLAVDLGAVAWRVQLGKPMGRLCENRHKLLRPEDLLTVLPTIARLKQSSPIWVDVGDSIGYFGPYEKTLRRSAWGNMRDQWTGCQAGRFAIGIESDGGVKGCLSLQARLDGCEGGRDPFREGDLRTQRLAEIWFASGAFAFNREQDLEKLSGACRGCRHQTSCRGGAKCVAAAFTGALTEDPYCYHRVARLASRRVRVAQEVRRGAAAALFSLGVGVTLGGCLAPVGPEQPEPGADAS
ncbi:MAG: radical SAM protein [Deltaproteobacteria bacterium]|nr:radical SAM protein [Deltaproteobacteria bacterium]